MFPEILLAVDDSEHSMRAAKHAGDLARRLNAHTLRIVVALDPLPYHFEESMRQLALEARLQEANVLCSRARTAAGSIPGEIQPEFIEGSPAKVIVDLAKRRGSALIVIGTRGLSITAELLLGSTSHKVVSRAPCPVLIVP